MTTTPQMPPLPAYLDPNHAAAQPAGEARAADAPADLDDTSGHPPMLHVIMRPPPRPVRTPSPTEDLHLFAHCLHLTRMNGAPHMLGLRDAGLPLPYANSRMLEYLASRHMRRKPMFLGILRHINELHLFEQLMCVGYDVMARSLFISPAVFRLDDAMTPPDPDHLDA